MSKKSIPTERCLSLYAYLFEQVKATGSQPSYEELAIHFGMVVRNGLAYHMKRLQETGYIARHNQGSRSIKFLKTPSGLPFYGFEERTNPPEPA